MKKMILNGKGTKEYIHENYAECTPTETVVYLIDTMTKLTASTHDEIRRCILAAFETKTIFHPDGNDENTILFRPDELKIYFRSKFGATGTFDVNTADIDAFFEGKPYTLSSFTEDELEMVKKVTGIESVLMEKLGELLEKGKAYAMSMTNVETDKIDFSKHPDCPPIELYAKKLKCEVEPLLQAITDAADDDETSTSSIHGVPLGKVVVDEDRDEARVFNIAERVFGIIPLDILFEVDENGQGNCPCPNCWKARHLGIVPADEPKTKPTLH